LTENGKVDRKKLPGWERRGKQQKRRARTPEEEMLCGMFAEVLGLEEVGIEEDFFQLGGHSLMATRLVSRIRGVFGVEVPLRSVFEGGTVEKLAEYVKRSPVVGGELKAGERPERVPLSYAQQRLWFIDRLEGRSTEYNIPLGLRLRGELNEEALERAVKTIVGRHESLRTHFEEEEGEAVQKIEREVRVGIVVEDLRGKGKKEQEEGVEEGLRREWEEPFDLGTGPLLRMKLLKLEEREHVLLVTMHHIVTDGWSQGVFSRELVRLYEGYREGGESD
jgi:acyl carrier protein